MQLPQQFKRDDKDYFDKKSIVKNLSPKDFDDMKTFILKSKAPTFVLFYAPWCGYCKKYKDEHLKIAKAIFDCVDVCAFNCEKYNDHVQKMNLDFSPLKKGEKFVGSYPTLYFYENGKPIKFEGDRNVENIINFILTSCKMCSSKGCVKKNF